MKKFGRLVFFTSACLLGACATMSTQETAALDTHPELTPQEMYISCAECHQEATPDLHDEWYDSVHGIAMVKCYQCHGTFETFRVTPAKSDCAVCHENMIEKCPQDKPCWDCHIPHSFTIDA